MADSSLVAPASPHVNCSNPYVTQIPGSIDFTSLRDTSSTEGENVYGGMSAFWSTFKGKRISEASCKFIMSSWRSATKKQYGIYIQRSIKFYHRKESDPLHSSIGTILDFLTGLRDQGLSYAAINTAKSELSSLVALSDEAADRYTRCPAWGQSTKKNVVMLKRILAHQHKHGTMQYGRDGHFAAKMWIDYAHSSINLVASVLVVVTKT